MTPGRAGPLGKRAAEDWHNIIDLADWTAPLEPRPAGGGLRIGRHT